MLTDKTVVNVILYNFTEQCLACKLIEFDVDGNGNPYVEITLAEDTVLSFTNKPDTYEVIVEFAPVSHHYDIEGYRVAALACDVVRAVFPEGCSKLLSYAHNSDVQLPKGDKGITYIITPTTKTKE